MQTGSYTLEPPLTSWAETLLSSGRWGTTTRSGRSSTTPAGSMVGWMCKGTGTEQNILSLQRFPFAGHTATLDSVGNDLTTVGVRKLGKQKRRLKTEEIFALCQMWRFSGVSYGKKGSGLKARKGGNGKDTVFWDHDNKAQGSSSFLRISLCSLLWEHHSKPWRQNCFPC